VEVVAGVEEVKMWCPENPPCILSFGYRPLLEKSEMNHGFHVIVGTEGRPSTPYSSSTLVLLPRQVGDFGLSWEEDRLGRAMVESKLIDPRLISASSQLVVPAWPLANPPGNALSQFAGQYLA